MRNSRRFNSILVLVLAVAMVMSSVAGVFAGKRDEAAQKEKEAAAARAQRIEALKDAEAMVDRGHLLVAQIEEKQAQINETKAKLEAKQKEVDQQEQDLGDRLTAMYKTGTVGYVDVILSSEGITDLIQNIGMVQKILESDEDMLAKLEDEYKEIDKLKQQQETQMAELKDKKAECDMLAEKYKKTADDYAAREKALEAQADKLIAQAIAEESKHPSLPNPTPMGAYCWPTRSNYIITSNYGYRICPFHGPEFHNGLDIVLTSGTHGSPVYAVADGYIERASWYSGYGHCIILNTGNGIRALYGHLSGYNCSYGRKVSKGQVIGYIGSTGNSTGPHLHFTVYRNGSEINPWSLY